MGFVDPVLSLRDRFVGLSRSLYSGILHFAQDEAPNCITCDTKVPGSFGTLNWGIFYVFIFRGIQAKHVIMHRGILYILVQWWSLELDSRAVMAGKVAGHSVLWWREAKIGFGNNLSQIRIFKEVHIFIGNMFVKCIYEGWVIGGSFLCILSEITQVTGSEVSLLIYDSAMSDASINVHLAVATTRRYIQYKFLFWNSATF